MRTRAAWSSRPPPGRPFPGDPRVTSERRFGWWWPRRRLWPTRDGWWCLGAALGLGFAAINTGNNLLYLLVSMLLGLIIVSGVLSEQSIRRVRVEPVLPDELFAGQLALFGARVANRKRWRASYSITVEGLGGSHRAYLAKLEPGAERLITWQETPRARRRSPSTSSTTAPRSRWSGPTFRSRSAAGVRSARASSRRSPCMSPPLRLRRRGPRAPRRTHGSARSAWRWTERVAPPGAPPRDAPPRVRRSRGPAPRGAGRRCRRPGGRRRRGRDVVERAAPRPRERGAGARARARAHRRDRLGARPRLPRELDARRPGAPPALPAPLPPRDA